MSDLSHRKKRPLCVYRILYKYTDEENALTTGQILQLLFEEYGIEAERKSVYDDIQVLESLGADIELRKGKGNDMGYKLLTREFELSQLKLLVDTVQSSRFLTEEKSRELIEKITSLASKHQGAELRRHVNINGRVKSENREIYYNIDLINRAINEKKKIKFKYFNLNEKKEKIYRRGGEYYHLSAWEMTVSEEKYYLIAYDSLAGTFKHFRVDKMEKCQITDEASECDKIPKSAGDVVEYTGRMFGMFGSGKNELAVLRVPAELAGVIIDRFGSSVNMIPEKDGFFTVAVKVCISRQFYGWIFGLSEKIEIISPEYVKKEYGELLKNAMENNRN